MNASWWKEFGLNGLIMGSVIGLLTYVIHMTLCTTRDILKRADESQKTWQSVFTQVSIAIESHSSNSKMFHEQVESAHRYQREDHERLERLQEKNVQAMNEVQKALGRINGYKAEHTQ